MKRLREKKIHECMKQHQRKRARIEPGAQTSSSSLESASSSSSPSTQTSSSSSPPGLLRSRRRLMSTESLDTGSNSSSSNNPRTSNDSSSQNGRDSFIVSSTNDGSSQNGLDGFIVSSKNESFSSGNSLDSFIVSDENDGSSSGNSRDSRIVSNTNDGSINNNDRDSLRVSSSNDESISGNGRDSFIVSDKNDGSSSGNGQDSFIVSSSSSQNDRVSFIVSSNDGVITVSDSSSLIESSDADDASSDSDSDSSIESRSGDDSSSEISDSSSGARLSQRPRASKRARSSKRAKSSTRARPSHTNRASKRERSSKSASQRERSTKRTSKRASQTTKSPSKRARSSKRATSRARAPQRAKSSKRSSKRASSRARSPTRASQSNRASKRSSQRTRSSQRARSSTRAKSPQRARSSKRSFQSRRSYRRASQKRHSSSSSCFSRRSRRAKLRRCSARRSRSFSRASSSNFSRSISSRDDFSSENERDSFITSSDDGSSRCDADNWSDARLSPRTLQKELNTADTSSSRRRHPYRRRAKPTNLIRPSLKRRRSSGNDVRRRRQNTSASALKRSRNRFRDVFSQSSDEEDVIHPRKRARRSTRPRVDHLERDGHVRTARTRRERICLPDKDENREDDIPTARVKPIPRLPTTTDSEPPDDLLPQPSLPDPKPRQPTPPAMGAVRTDDRPEPDCTTSLDCDLINDSANGGKNGATVTMGQKSVRSEAIVDDVIIDQDESERPTLDNDVIVVDSCDDIIDIGDVQVKCEAMDAGNMDLEGNIGVKSARPDVIVKDDVIIIDPDDYDLPDLPPIESEPEISVEPEVVQQSAARLQYWDCLESTPAHGHCDVIRGVMPSRRRLRFTYAQCSSIETSLEEAAVLAHSLWWVDYAMVSRAMPRSLTRRIAREVLLVSGTSALAAAAYSTLSRALHLHPPRRQTADDGQLIGVILSHLKTEQDQQSLLNHALMLNYTVQAFQAELFTRKLDNLTDLQSSAVQQEFSIDSSTSHHRLKTIIDNLSSALLSLAKLNHGHSLSPRSILESVSRILEMVVLTTPKLEDTIDSVCDSLLELIEHQSGRTQDLVVWSLRPALVVEELVLRCENWSGVEDVVGAVRRGVGTRTMDRVCLYLETAVTIARGDLTTPLPQRQLQKRTSQQTPDSVPRQLPFTRRQLEKIVRRVEKWAEPELRPHLIRLDILLESVFET